jgi:hypothetical protein
VKRNRRVRVLRVKKVGRSLINLLYTSDTASVTASVRPERDTTVVRLGEHQGNQPQRSVELETSPRHSKLIAQRICFKYPIGPLDPRSRKFGNSSSKPQHNARTVARMFV